MADIPQQHKIQALPILQADHAFFIMDTDISAVCPQYTVIEYKPELMMFLWLFLSEQLFQHMNTPVKISHIGRVNAVKEIIKMKGFRVQTQQAPEIVA
jgi:hypothetical protein